MKKLFAIGLLLSSLIPTFVAQAGPCDSASDRASDGSRCSGRASPEREFGECKKRGGQPGLSSNSPAAF